MTLMPSLTKAFDCTPKAGNLTLKTCSCLYDNETKWIVYSEDVFTFPSSSYSLLLNQQQHQTHNTTNSTKLEPKRISSDVANNNSNDGNFEIVATSTYNKKKSKCVVRTENKNSKAERKLYCPIDVYNLFEALNLTLEVISRRNHANETIVVKRWARYILPREVNSCECRITQKWKMRQDINVWDSLHFHWTLPEKAAEYMQYLTSATAEISIKQDGKKAGHCKSTKPTKDYSCFVAKITDNLDYRKPFTACLEMNIAMSCYPESQGKLCKNSTLNPDIMFNHFALKDSRISCETTVNGRTSTTRVSWAIGNENEATPRGLIYALDLFGDSGRVNRTQIPVVVGGSRAKTTFTFKEFQVNRAIINLCLLPSPRSSKKCASPKKMQCTFIRPKEVSSLYPLLLLLLIIPISLVLVYRCFFVKDASNKFNKPTDVDDILRYVTNNQEQEQKQPATHGVELNASTDDESPSYAVIVDQQHRDENEFDHIDLEINFSLGS